mmetsp:Transcript_29746/g.78495  ORF Transcript_29746/g.78495 Transcript_29746/m.78495 type:complete len:593 (-) Transcript_29746:262-2040(-)
MQWLLAPDSKVQLSGHSTVAVWALIMGSAWFFLGCFAVFEVIAANKKLIALRDQLRTILLLTTLFIVAWVITGNAWIIGDFSSFGVVPQDCKDGNMGNRNLYHYCLAMLIFFDIVLPLFFIGAAFMTADFKNKTILNKTFLGPASATTPPDVESSMSSASSSPAEVPKSSLACCTFPIAVSGFIFSTVVLFLIFVTIAGQLGQDGNAFCQGYWRKDPKYQLGNHSIIAVWALLQGSAFFFCGFLWLLENIAAGMRAISLRDRIRTILLLHVLFTLAWMIAGNVWILGDENNMGKVPDDCKNGAMGDRNLYHFCISIIIIMDVLIPIGMFVVFALTYDFKYNTICNRPLYFTRAGVYTQSGELPFHARKSAPCCSIPVSLFALFWFALVFIVFIVVPSILEPGVMRRPWDQTFCNGYWKTNPKYQLSGHPTAAVWALLQGSTIIFIGFLWILENLAASMGARAFRDQVRTLILLSGLFGFCWLIQGNIWILGDEKGHSSLGVIPQDCKDGNMGNRNLYHFCEAMIIFLDIVVPLGALAVAVRTGLNKTLMFYDRPAVTIPAPEPVPEPHVAEKPAAPVPEIPSQAVNVFIGQA